ncbi:MAG TPA: hypothetical protein VJ508_09445, partial [Saprospiraceae bacterium]|nr:hypothetical protein [Saprospiraceae bacterium]
MKKGCLLVFFISLGISAFGQTRIDTLSGAVSYKTVLNVYVRFESTKGISVGDTLFSEINGNAFPALVVSQMSSTSCVAKLIDTGHDFKVGDQIYYYRKRTAADVIPSPPVAQKIEPSP